ncbi:MAG: hypothetical protein RLZZ224_736 [Verrucomicrobiota bacterium]
MKFINRLLLVLMWLSWFQVQAQETYFRKVYDNTSGSYIEATALFSKLPVSGFAPVRITVANRLNAPVKFSFSFVSNSKSYYRNDDVRMKSQFSIACPAAQVQSTDLIVPVAALVRNSGYSYGEALTLNMDMYGVTQGTASQSSHASPDFPQLLMSEELYTPNASALDGELNKSKGGSSTYRGDLTYAGKFDPKQMPEDWRAYLGYDGMMLTNRDWQQMTPGARAAVLLWNRQGGWLQFFAVNEVVNLASMGIIIDDEKNSMRGLGHVQLESLGADLKLDPASWVHRAQKSATAPHRQAEVLQKEYSSGTWKLPAWLGVKTFYFVIFIILLLIFGILVGPINLFVFAKSGQRHKLFVTTPLISLGASFVMIILIFAQDGIGGTGVRVQWMHLVHEQGDHHAYIHQEQLCRTGVLMGSSFLIHEPCLLTPLALAPSQWARLSSREGPTQSFEIASQDNAWRATGDWFQSRSEQAQWIQTIRPSRARIERVNAADPTKLMSNLDFALDRLYLRDEQGRLWKAQNVAPGQTFSLQTCPDAEWQQLVDQELPAISEWQQKRIRNLTAKAHNFIALSKDAPMIETSTSTKWKRSETIITGQLPSLSAR